MRFLLYTPDLIQRFDNVTPQDLSTEVSRNSEWVTDRGGLWARGFVLKALRGRGGWELGRAGRRWGGLNDEIVP